MIKQDEKKLEYIAPEVELSYLSKISILEVMSVDGVVNDFEDGDDF